MPKLRIVFAIYPDVTHLDFTGPHQVLSRAPDADVLVGSAGGADIHGDGLTFTGLVDLAKVERCDVLCVPGGYGCTAAMEDEAYMRDVARLARGATYVTSVCTGSLILGAAGLLKGRRATSHWAWRHLLPLFGATVSEARVERDGNLFTGGGVTAGIDMAFVVLEELAGRDYAESIQLSLEYAPEPPFNAGRPELARPEILERVRAQIAKVAEPRAAATAQVAARVMEMA